MVKIRSVIANIIGSVIGLLLGFFLIGAALFSDAGSIGERMFTFIVVVIFYSIISLGLAIISRTSRAYVSMTIPAVMMSFSLFTLDGAEDMSRVALYLIYPVLALISSLVPFILINTFFRIKEPRK